VAKYETFLRGITATTLDAALAKKEFDFVEEVSADFPIRVLARLLGVPDSDTGQLIEWGNRMVGNTDPEHADVLIGSADSEEYKHVPFRSPAAIEVYEYGKHLAAERRGKGGTDLVTLLADGVPSDGLPLTEHEFNTNFLLLVVAGNETTRHTISHSMNNLLANPSQLESLIPWAVEEFLRFASPVYHFRRTATRDVAMHGKEIKADDKVVVWFASGNRDESMFPHPYEFDVTRKPNEHMAFGRGGPHMCLGNSLARLEITHHVRGPAVAGRFRGAHWAGRAPAVELRQRHQALPCEGLAEVVVPPCVYSMRMARINVYLPDELAERVKSADLNVSAVVQQALDAELRRLSMADWWEQVRKLPPVKVDVDSAALIRQIRDEREEELARRMGLD